MAKKTVPVKGQHHHQHQEKIQMLQNQVRKTSRETAQTQYSKINENKQVK